MTDIFEPDSSVTPYPGPWRLRLRAASTHLLLSLCVAALAFSLVHFVWFPSAYWQMAGGRELFFLIVSVDVVLGPCITLAIFNPGKGRGRLKFDLIIVALLQLAALLYGLYSVAQARPAYLVYAVDRFTVVTAAALDDGELVQASQPAYRYKPWTGPRLVSTRRPATAREQAQLLEDGLRGHDIELQPRYYVAYEDAAAQVAARARSLEELRAKNPSAQSQALLDDALRQLAKDPASLRWLPVIARADDWVAILDSHTGLQPVAYLPLQGF